MADQVLIPTAHLTGSRGTADVLDADLAYDADLATFCQVRAPGIADAGSVTVYGFPEDVDVVSRSAVHARINFNEINWGANDTCSVFFKAHAAGAWTKVKVYSKGQLTPSGWREIDLTALAGSAPSTGWRLGIVFSRFYDPPNPEG